MRKKQLNIEYVISDAVLPSGVFLMMTTWFQVETNIPEPLSWIWYNYSP